MNVIKSNKIDVVFNGHDLSHYFTILDIDRPLMGSPEVTTATVEGRDGAIYLGTRFKDYDVAVTVMADCVTPEDMREAFFTLAGWLRGMGKRKLQFSDEGDRYRLATPSATDDIVNYGLTTGTATVTFEIPDGHLWGKEWTYESTSGVVELNIKGTIAAPLVIEAASASGTWSLMDDEGNTLRVEIGSSAKHLIIDTETGEVRIGGNTSMITLDSDWLELEPGAHTLTRTAGSGEYTVTYIERWAG